MEWLFEYAERVRDPQTALITGRDQDPLSQMNGLFKLSCSSWWEHDRPMPRTREVIDTVLEQLTEDDGFGPSCADMNGSLLLCMACRQEEGYRYEEVVAAVSGPILRRLDARRKPDGGISFHIDHCQTHFALSREIAPPLPEGDLFGAHQQLHLLNSLEKLVAGAR